MMSAKAKGKQRAPDTPDVHTPSASPSTLPVSSSRKLIIRFAEGDPDLTVEVFKADAVRDVKNTIRTARPRTRGRRLRLIHLGRLLPDGTNVYSWLASVDQRQNNASTPEGEHVTTSLEETSVDRTTTWVHCSVGPPLQQGEEDEERGPQIPQMKPLRGFDRLAAAGFTETDIASIRRQFHSQSSSNFLDSDFDNEEDYEEHTRALEEQWIDSMDTAGSATLSDSSPTAVFSGAVAGFFFPILPFFFFREARPAVFWEDGSEQPEARSAIFSRHMQMGLVIGFCLNVIFGLWRYLLGTGG